MLPMDHQGAILRSCQGTVGGTDSWMLKLRAITVTTARKMTTQGGEERQGQGRNTEEQLQTSLGDRVAWNDGHH